MVLTSDPGAIAASEGLVVPGVGAFAACMEQFVAVGGPDLVTAFLASDKPVLGICVGHQILFDAGVEHGEEAHGLGLLPGVVGQLPATRLPHMGWNTVEVGEGSVLFTGVERERFYFVHSYAALAAPADATVSWTDHDGARFVSAVESGRLSSTQFHPEKSGEAGARLLRNWVATL